jgi:hypothetical protein
VSLNKAAYASSLNGYLRTNSDLCHLQHELVGFYKPEEAACASSLKGYLRTNLCHLQHKLIGFHNPDEKCLQCGTD